MYYTITPYRAGVKVWYVLHHHAVPHRGKGAGMYYTITPYRTDVKVWYVLHHHTVPHSSTLAPPVMP